MDVKSGDTVRVWDWRFDEYYEAVATTDAHDNDDGEHVVGLEVDIPDASGEVVMETVQHYAVWNPDEERWDDGCV